MGLGPWMGFETFLSSLWATSSVENRGQTKHDLSPSRAYLSQLNINADAAISLIWLKFLGEMS